ncbi:glycosyltransferase [Paenibacillus sp. FSL E2-8871]|uniref:glycosyltransferase n=1 Tax=Paenibacillus sp. FSL E2-8871 TaxID=2975326 RepID=UPI0030FB25A7
MEKSIRVLHLLQSDKYSGAENVVCEIIEMFRDTELDMVYSSQDGPIKNVLDGRKIKFMPMKYISISEVRRVVREYKPDIIHAHDFTASILCALAVNCTIISHLHNNSPWIKKYGLRSLEFLASCFRYKKILTVSESILDEYVFSDLISRKTIMVGNPINIDAIQKKALTPNSKTGNFDLIFLGRLVTAKNPIRLIKIVKVITEKFPDIKVAVIGDGELRQECEKLIEELELVNTITLLGFLENPYPILGNSKILCMTSDWEGFGLVAVEAMALGRPVVCTYAGGLKQIINNETGMLCSSDSEFCDEIYKLLTNVTYLEMKSKNAASRAKTLDNILSYREMLKNIYLD